ncbi:unnamed protein product [Polarella glacialis]|uniref:Feruloyl esterase n=1 Tax=Polarella glacialis TaxID=89957 RepID=A0A813FMH8_POLGL|nr:unnamed protein product [Polarella glacialis]|mmetsp:Transcript_65771/g.106028  ORF Transcript_65771/g.106028 Transcript_65771/m.106028 type:complete len:432 (+) Transcript_65771:75-1370(+)
MALLPSCCFIVLFVGTFSSDCALEDADSCSLIQSSRPAGLPLKQHVATQPAQSSEIPSALPTDESAWFPSALKELLEPAVEFWDNTVRLGSLPTNKTIVSGLSSGADFAVQFQVAYSASVQGAAIFAGQPYSCAVVRFPLDQLVPKDSEVPNCIGCPPNETLVYDHCKVHPDWVDVKMLGDLAKEKHSKGLIDCPKNLESHRIYLYRGTKDPIYLKGTVKNTEGFFAQFVPQEQLLYEGDVPGGHAYPLLGDTPYPCGGSGPLAKLFLQSCQYDGPGRSLQHIYEGKLADPGQREWSSLRWFDQEPFYGEDNEVTGLDKWALIYVPKACHTETCDLVVSFHGCGFVFPGLYEWLVTGLTFNQWAESNNMVVIYPRLKAHGTSSQFQQGCWNVYGQTGLDYADKGAAQMAAIKKMVDDIPSLKIWDFDITIV